MTRGCIITFEGNIGAGKTTFLNRFYSDPYVNDIIPNLVLRTEPVAKYEDTNGYNYLKAYYDDPKGNAFKFQVLAIALMGETIAEANNMIRNSTILIDRGPHSCKMFTELQLTLGNLETNEYDILDMLSKHTLHTNLIDAVVVIDTDPPTCARNVSSRGRPEERNMSISYLDEVDKMVNKMFPKSPDDKPSRTVEGKVVFHLHTLHGYEAMRDKLIDIIKVVTWNQ